MTDYESLYNQTQLVVQKQKQQIKKLEQQIRQRCQSYLIHSSRYRSKNLEMSSKKSAASEPDQQLPILSVSHKAIQLTIQPTRTIHQVNNEQKTQSAQATPQKDVQSSFKINESDSKQQISQSQTFNQKVYWRNPDSNPMPSANKTQESENSGTEKVQNHQKQSKTGSRPQSEPHVNWQEVVSGYKDRIASVQRQKSQLAQKVIDLEQQIKGYKKQQKTWAENMSSMKKKQTKSLLIESSASNANDAEEKAKNNQKILNSFFQTLADQINFQQAKSLQEKIKLVQTYVKQLSKIQQSYQENNNLQQSKVNSYIYSTPYKDIKNDGQNSHNQSRDHYQQQQIQMLRRKCKELQGQLSQSRINKNNESPFQNDVGGVNQQQIKDPPYLIEQQLEKPNSPYVKRSFVRKKVVKRNLSAMILRSPSKSKEESRQAMKNQLEKLKSHLQKSKDGKNDKQISSMTKKIQSLEKKLQLQEAKIDEMSEQNQSVRASGVSSQGNFTQIIQVQTEGPGFKNYTAHILGLNKKDKTTHEKQKKQPLF